MPQLSRESYARTSDGRYVWLIDERHNRRGQIEYECTPLLGEEGERGWLTTDHLAHQAPTRIRRERSHWEVVRVDNETISIAANAFNADRLRRLFNRLGMGYTEERPVDD